MVEIQKKGGEMNTSKLENIMYVAMKKALRKFNATMPLRTLDWMNWSNEATDFHIAQYKKQLKKVA